MWFNSKRDEAIYTGASWFRDLYLSQKRDALDFVVDSRIYCRISRMEKKMDHDLRILIIKELWAERYARYSTETLGKPITSASVFILGFLPAVLMENDFSSRAMGPVILANILYFTHAIFLYGILRWLSKHKRGNKRRKRISLLLFFQSDLVSMSYIAVIILMFLSTALQNFLPISQTDYTIILGTSLVSTIAFFLFSFFSMPYTVPVTQEKKDEASRKLPRQWKNALVIQGFLISTGIFLSSHAGSSQSFKVYLSVGLGALCPSLMSYFFGLNLRKYLLISLNPSV